MVKDLLWDLSESFKDQGSFLEVGGSVQVQVVAFIAARLSGSMQTALQGIFRW